MNGEQNCVPAQHGREPVKVHVVSGNSAPICSTVRVWWESHHQLALGQAAGHSLVCARLGRCGGQQESLGKGFRAESSRESYVYPQIPQ